MPADKSEKTARLLCILSTVLMIICNVVAPVAMFLWLGAATPRQQDKYAMDVIVVTVLGCGAGMIASLIMAIIARLKEPGSKWALVCIIISAILLVTGVLAAFFTVWAASQYQYYG
jgi:hypothetical protein